MCTLRLHYQVTSVKQVLCVYIEVTLSGLSSKTGTVCVHLALVARLLH